MASLASVIQYGPGPLLRHDTQSLTCPGFLNGVSWPIVPMRRNTPMATAEYASPG